MIVRNLRKGDDMYRGTTPTIPIRVKGIDLTGARLFLTFESPTKKQLTLECPGDFTVELDGEDTVGYVELTQEQTLTFSPIDYYVQIRWIDSDGNANTTDVQKINVKDVLLKGVIHYD